MTSKTCVKTALISVLAATVAVAASGCDRGSEPLHRISPVGSPTSGAAAASARTVASDEAAIRKLVERRRQVLEDYDIDALVAMNCVQEKEATRKNMLETLAPMSDLGTPEEAKNPEIVAKMPGELVQRHPKLSIETARQVVDAWHRQDQAAFDIANRKVMAEITSIEAMSIDNIKVTGDTATGDLRKITTYDNEEPVPKVSPVGFLFEGGEWKNCTK
ncbi:hypothetical protein FZI91_06445 [Mycobacterium sp. CBMA271]|uniref:hypothetical protein n=1 Tax=unclassified Mycobacteroides TaxID=2618759 RepID=UPI0012DD4868|nr:MULTISPECIES: hypothetical protein [unclassified Mycobacteroides]MUM15444.1 hypothetical protein [Mycobacteroides sp. CBMA 326]MUM21344.1 hypothetical protein [Mycobacteroides sp. CBMA 271]